MPDPTIRVLSKDPPGGRCRLYTQYAEAVSHRFGLTMHVICPDDSHPLQAPGLMIGDDGIPPSDDVIIAPEDVCNALARPRYEGEPLAALRQRLEAIVEETLGTG